MERVVVAGVGIHPFGRFEADYRQLGAVAAREALVDAGVGFDDVELTLVGNVGAEMAKGQNVMTLSGGAAVRSSTWRVRAARAGSALFLGAQLIESGAQTSCCARVEKAPRGYCRLGYSPWQIEAGLGVNPSTSPSPRKSCSRRPTPRSRTSPTSV